MGVIGNIRYDRYIHQGDIDLGCRAEQETHLIGRDVATEPAEVGKCDGRYPVDQLAKNGRSVGDVV